MKKNKNKKKKNNLKKVILVITIIIILCILGFVGYNVITNLNKKEDNIKNIYEQEGKGYKGYYDYDLYKNRVYNSIPFYVDSKDLKLKDNESFIIPFKYEKDYASTVVVNEHPNNYSFDFDSDYTGGSESALNQNLIAFKKNTNNMSNVYRTSEGYLVYYSFNQKGTDSYLEFYDDKFEYQWTYKMKDNSTYIINDYLEVNGDYHFLISYNNSKGKYLVVGKEGKSISEIDLKYEPGKFLNNKDNKVYFSTFSDYAYYNLKTKKVTKEAIGFKLPIYRTVNYTLDGYVNNNYYFTSEGGDSSELNEEQYLMLYKISKEGEILNKVNLRELIDPSYKSNTDYDYVFRTYVKDDRIFVEYDVFYIGNGEYSGVLLLDLDLNFIKNYSSKDKSDTVKELGVKKIYNIPYYQYKNNNIYFEFNLDNSSSLYVVYDNMGNMISKKSYELLYSYSGTLLTSYFDSEELVHYNEYQFNNKSYMKISNIDVTVEVPESNEEKFEEVSESNEKEAFLVDEASMNIYIKKNS